VILWDGREGESAITQSISSMEKSTRACSDKIIVDPTFPVRSDGIGESCNALNTWVIFLRSFLLYPFQVKWELRSREGCMHQRHRTMTSTYAVTNPYFTSMGLRFLLRDSQKETTPVRWPPLDTILGKYRGRSWHSLLPVMPVWLDTARLPPDFSLIEYRLRVAHFPAFEYKLSAFVLSETFNVEGDHLVAGSSMR